MPLSLYLVPPFIEMWLIRYVSVGYGKTVYYVLIKRAKIKDLSGHICIF